MTGFRARPRSGSRHELLLRAALGEDDVAVAAWQTWRTHVVGDLTSLDVADARMLPLVHANLLGAGAEPRAGASTDGSGVAADDADVLRRIRRGAWSRTQALFSAVRPALVDLQQSGIDVVLIKGASLALAAYGDVGVRPMSDVDVLVPSRRALDAGRILEAHGFVPHVRLDAGRVATWHGIGFARAATETSPAATIDLHWHMVREPCDASLDEQAFAHAREVMFAGASVRALHPTEELVVACVHGYQWNPMPPFRWVADVHVLVSNAGDGIDWDRFLATTERHGFGLPVHAALSYVVAQFSTPVPARVITALEALTPTRRERAEMMLRVSPWTGRLFGRLPRHIVTWARLREVGAPGGRHTSLPRYLADAWGHDGQSDVRRHAVASARRRLSILWHDR